MLLPEIQLREEISANHSQLELYSSSLKDLVDEKTGELEISKHKYRELLTIRTRFLRGGREK